MRVLINNFESCFIRSDKGVIEILKYGYPYEKWYNVNIEYDAGTNLCVISGHKAKVEYFSDESYKRYDEEWIDKVHYDYLIKYKSFFTRKEKVKIKCGYVELKEHEKTQSIIKTTNIIIYEDKGKNNK